MLLTAFRRSEDANIRIRAPTISRSHASLTVGSNGAVWIRNLSKTKAVHVNDEKFGTDGQRPLRQGDIFSVGDRKFRFDYRKYWS